MALRWPPRCSASIGGIGTLVGSPPNAIAAAQAGIGFADWMRIGVPLVLVLLPLMVGVLYLLARRTLRAGRTPCGGLALSEVMGVSGASRFLAGALSSALQDAPPLLLLLGLVAFVVFLTELVSNTAAAALLVPVFLGAAVSSQLPPPLLAAAIAASASCAFMLPVATPPNAIVHATGQVPQATMLRCGLVLNLVCILVITLVATVVLG